MSNSVDKVFCDLKEKRKEKKLSLGETFPVTYKNFKKYWPEVEDDHFKMFTRKRVYPYEY